MAENHPDDLETLQDVTASDNPESGEETAQAVSIHGPSDESKKDTLESGELQAELADRGENNVVFGADGPPQPVVVPHSIDKDSEKLMHDLEDAKKAMTELMAWKEDLRLLAMQHNTLAPYYDNWTKEANLFFRRLVIINKRFESLRKKKRA